MTFLTTASLIEKTVGKKKKRKEMSCLTFLGPTTAKPRGPLEYYGKLEFMLLSSHSLEGCVRI